MDPLLLSVIAVIALALLFDFSNGFHDAANSVATVVATKAMPPRMAVWFSAVCNFAAFLFVGTAVASTVAKVVKTGDESVSVVFAALIAAIAWNYATWFVGMPSSSSHAIIGGLVGAGVAAGGLAAISWDSVEKTGIAIVLSPAVALTVGAAATLLVVAIQKLTGWGEDAKPFKGLQLVSAAAVSFGHGANDAQKTMGVIAAVLVGAGYLDAPDSKHLPVPMWVALAAYGAIAVGTVWGGWRIIETMGLRIAPLTSRTGVAANIGATTAIFGATELGIPISTTHAAASSVVGAGLGARRGVNFGVIGRMVVAWVITIPATAALGWVGYELTQLPRPFNAVVVGAVVVGLGGWIVWAMRNSISHREIQAEIDLADPLTVDVAAAEPAPVASGRAPVGTP